MKKAKSSPSKLYPNDRFPPEARDLPATQGMLWLVRTELKEEMKAGFHQISAEMVKMGAAIAGMSSEITRMRSETKSEMAQMRSEMKSEMAQMHSETKSEMAQMRSETKSEMAQMNSELARMGVLIEEQRADNRIVLEALTGHAQRQDRIERRIDEVEDTVRSLAKARSKSAGSSG